MNYSGITGNIPILIFIQKCIRFLFSKEGKYVCIFTQLNSHQIKKKSPFILAAFGSYPLTIATSEVRGCHSYATDA